MWDEARRQTARFGGRSANAASPQPHDAGRDRAARCGLARPKGRARASRGPPRPPVSVRAVTDEVTRPPAGERGTRPRSTAPTGRAWSPASPRSSPPTRSTSSTSRPGWWASPTRGTPCTSSSRSPPAWPAPRSGSACGCAALTSPAIPRPGRAPGWSRWSTPRWWPPAPRGRPRGLHERARPDRQPGPAGHRHRQGQDPGGATRLVEADAIEARALLHELDHLDGLLFLDRVVSASTDLFRRQRYR